MKKLFRRFKTIETDYLINLIKHISGPAEAGEPGATALTKIPTSYCIFI